MGVVLPLGTTIMVIVCVCPSPQDGVPHDTCSQQSRFGVGKSGKLFVELATSVSCVQ